MLCVLSDERASTDGTKRFSYFVVVVSTLLCKLHMLGLAICLLGALIFWSKTMLYYAGFCAVATVVWWLIALVVAMIPTRDK